MPKDVAIHQHLFVPKHLLMNEDEVQALLSRFNISKKQMPTISPKDPAIKDLNIKTGDVIKIIRNSPTQVKCEFYRVVRE